MEYVKYSVARTRMSEQASLNQFRMFVTECRKCLDAKKKEMKAH